jgi:recombinational DNA repair protein RecT
MNTKEASSSDTTLATTEKKLPLLAGIQAQIANYERDGRWTFRSNFNVGNAMASAKVALVEAGIIDLNGNPTGACTTTSLVNAVHDCMTQGMNVGKDQGYFINRNKVLGFMRSYHGDKNLGEAVIAPAGYRCEIYDGLILKGEKFVPVRKMTKRGLITVVDEHKMAWPRTIILENIEAAYAGATLINESTGEFEDLGIELMTIDQIKNSWKKSPNASNPNSFHNQQPDIACKRTVIRRYTKSYIAASDDSILKAAIQRQEIDAIEAEVVEEIQENGNTQQLAQDPPTKTEVVAEPEGEKKEEF